MAIIYDKETDWKSNIKKMRIAPSSTIEPETTKNQSRHPHIHHQKWSQLKILKFHFQVKYIIIII